MGALGLGMRSIGWERNILNGMVCVGWGVIVLGVELDVWSFVSWAGL